MIRISLDVDKQLEYSKNLHILNGDLIKPKEFDFLTELGIDKKCSSPTAIGVWLTIQSFCNEFGSSIKSMEALADKAQISISSLRRYLKLLNKNHLITIEERFNENGGRETNRIFCNHPLLASFLLKIDKGESFIETPSYNYDTAKKIANNQEQSKDFQPSEQGSPSCQFDTPTYVNYVCNNMYINNFKNKKNNLSEKTNDIFLLLNENGIKLDIHKKSVHVVENHILSLSEIEINKLVAELKKYQDSGKIKNAAGWLIKSPEVVIKKALSGELNKEKKKAIDSTFENDFYSPIIFDAPIYSADNVASTATNDAVLVQELAIDEVKEIIKKEGLDEDVFFQHSPIYKTVESLTILSKEVLLFVITMVKKKIGVNCSPQYT